MKWAKQKGFTIVELLVVIVVVGILAALVVVAYSGVASRATQTKYIADLESLTKAIRAAQVSSGKTLIEMTTIADTGWGCLTEPTGTNLATLSTSDSCWVDYKYTLSVISNLSGANIQNLLDPWGRPYYIDENEGEGGGCTKDIIAMYAYPFVTMTPSSLPGTYIELQNSGNSGCAL